VVIGNILKMSLKINYIKVAVFLITLVVLVIPNSISAMTVNVGIPEKYAEIKAGEKVYFESEVKWPENIGRKDLRIEYSVLNKNGEEVAYLKVLKAIETQASFMDSISIPERIEPGMYKIYMKLSDYKDFKQEVAASFNVVPTSNETQTYLFVIIGLLTIVIIFLVIETFVKSNRNNNYNPAIKLPQTNSK
jgi:hypothetical protein